jgi:hypothetical protein
VDIVREVFHRRAGGASWKDLAVYLGEHGIKRSPSGVAGMLESRTYRGEVRGPQGAENVEAHEPLVTEEEWRAANRARGPAPEHTGRFGSTALVGGVLRCASCGRKMLVTGAGKGDKRRAVYYCRQHKPGDCEAPASAVAKHVDAYVRDAFAVALFDGTLETTVDAAADYNRKLEVVEKAHNKLDAHARSYSKFVDRFGEDAFYTVADELEAEKLAAEEDLYRAIKPGQVIVPTADLFGEEWPIERQRELARQYISRITLHKASEKGRGAEPVSERIEITWAGHEAPDASLAGRVAELRAKIPEAFREGLAA